MALRGIRLLQDGVQRGDHRHPQLFEQLQHMAARRPAVDPELVLQAQDVRPPVVEFISRRQIGIRVLLIDLKPHPARVIITLRAVVDGHHDALRVRFLRGHRLAEVMGEGGDATTAGHIVPEEGDPPGFGEKFHGLIKFAEPPRLANGKNFQRDALSLLLTRAPPPCTLWKCRTHHR
ncbi:MAG: hypothetical protein R6W95_13965 [Desulfosarcina sp.]